MAFHDPRRLGLLAFGDLLLGVAQTHLTQQVLRGAFGGFSFFRGRDFFGGYDGRDRGDFNRLFFNRRDLDGLDGFLGHLNGCLGLYDGGGLGGAAGFDRAD